jgi:hypothetical protein
LKGNHEKGTLRKRSILRTVKETETHYWKHNEAEVQRNSQEKAPSSFSRTRKRLKYPIKSSGRSSFAATAWGQEVQLILLAGSSLPHARDLGGRGQSGCAEQTPHLQNIFSLI